MGENIKFLLRKSTGDQPLDSEQQIRDWFLKGQCKPSDFLFDFALGQWSRVGNHPSLAPFFATPGPVPERKVIYFANPGEVGIVQGPFSTKEIQQKIQNRDLCESSWVFVDGDREWRRVQNIKTLLDLLPRLPADVPSAMVTTAAPSGDVMAAPVPPSPSSQTSPSIRIDFNETSLSGLQAPPTLGMPSAPAGEPSIPALSEEPKDVMSDSFIEREEQTKAVSALGLSATPEPTPPKPKPPVPPAHRATGSIPAPPPLEPQAHPARGTPPVGARPSDHAIPNERDSGSFDGITAEIPSDPIWLVKPAAVETVSGPFRFLEVVKFLEEGKLNKNDKISRMGTNRFVKIGQQYEFNVKFALETVVEHGVEKQKILIKRRHPRVPYITGVQVMSKHGLLAGSCVNISAGGILMEVPKAEFNLGEILEIKILPGLITKAISCRALVIGKIPKIPPGFALKFEDLKNEDKEAIEFYVQETLKREMAKHS